jgi:hypothetical protein
LLVNVPAVAVKAADTAPEATFTEAGTVSTALLLESATVTPPEPAACDSATVHAEVPPEPRVAGEQDSRLITIGAVSENEVVFELPL